MTSTRCSARPDALLDCASETELIVSELRGALIAFDNTVESFVFRAHGLFAALTWTDPLWSVVRALEDLADTVAAIAMAFEAAGGRGASGRSDLISSDAATIDRWVTSASWRPTNNLQPGMAGAWAAAALGAYCHSQGDAGYDGSGFLIGPDGRSYPLVAPHVTRDGHRVNADDHLVAGQPSVLDLDGRDPGWSTIYEQIGVERWRDEPGVGGRLLAAIGSTAAGPPTGSTEQDVDAVAIAPGQAPTLRRQLTPTPVPQPSPPVYAPNAPVVPPPNVPDVLYPNGQTSIAANGMNIGPVVIDGLIGFAHADLGSHDAYDVVFQSNRDGRIRALYRRVFVGFDDSGDAELDSVYVTGPERNDQVPIVYAPRG
ncbi:MAG TPA: hypothetical protein VGJ03_18475 [Acidimicrobiales bacterium]|jgi:hypothetical protein